MPYSFTDEVEKTVVQNYDLDVQLQDFQSKILDKDTIEISDDHTIGKLFPVDLNPTKNGAWNGLKNGDSIWRLKINSKQGAYMMLVFNEFFLPEGSTLFIYTEDKSQILGAFTSNNNTEYNKFTTTPLKGNSLIVEYYKPYSNERKTEKLNILSVGLIDENFGKIITKSLGESGDCMINATCPQYEQWCNQRRSVALIIRVLQDSREIRWCSGTLITNERRDNKPFLLTAFHCIDNLPENGSLEQAEKDEIQNWIFVFNYQSPGCANPSSDPSWIHSISGATYINSAEESDYALLRLNQKPPKHYNVYYSGWSNDENAITSTGACIHHPSGDIKKISEWEKAISLLPNFWRVKYTAGSTEPGSSGSALFNSSKYIVGQLKMGSAACDNNKADYFGRFDKSWHKFGLSWELNPHGTHSGSNQFYISSMSGDEICRDNWSFTSGNDLHTSDNVNFRNSYTIGTRQYDGVYNAKNSITASNVTIKSNTSVVFEAGNEIILNSGFCVELGGKFSASIGNCSNGCNDKNLSKNASNDEEVQEEYQMTIFESIQGSEKQ